MCNGIRKYGSTCATHRPMVVRFSLSMLKRDDISPSKNQLTAISSIVKKNDCVVCLPTGHGKILNFRNHTLVLHVSEQVRQKWRGPSLLCYHHISPYTYIIDG